MSTDVQPIPNQDGEVVAFVDRNQNFIAGPTLAQVEARNARFAALEASDPDKAERIETGTWSPRVGDTLRGFFIGLATMGRNPKPEEVEHVKTTKAKIEANDPDIIDTMDPSFRAEFLKEKVPFRAAAIETKNGIRFLSRIHAMEVFQSGRVPHNGGVWIKCIHEKQGEMSKFDIRELKDGIVQDISYTEE